MTNLRGQERAQFVQDMFTRIAPRYDLMNRLMTMGQDVHWRKIVIRKARLQAGSRLLDIGTGTGDLAFEALQSMPELDIVAGDFTIQMMRVGKTNPERADIQWNNLDALNLPFETGTFDAVVSGFLMRNVIDAQQALAEQYRILGDGGRAVILDTTRPRRSLVSPLVHLYMHRVIPLLGRLLTSDGDAYQYLPQSSEAFLYAEQLAELMVRVGFREVQFKRLNFGTIAVHSGVK